MHSRVVVATWFLMVVMFALAPFATADTATINPIKDNTLIDSGRGAASNGTGSIFSGRTGSIGGRERRLRAVLAFDITSSVPVGSNINSVSLRLRLEQTVSADQTHTLHRLTRDWGEGTSNAFGGNGAAATPNDATWTHTFYPDQFWTTPGGDFVAGASATQIVGADSANDYVWTDPQMAADVQAWLARPGCNFGWILLGNETPASLSAKKFYSREVGGDPLLRPRLVIDFTPPAFVCPADITRNGTVDADDLLAIISTWGACPPCPASCAGDIEPNGGNQQVNTDDLLRLISTWGACD